MRYVLDTNVMLLLVVGTAKEAWIESHKRTASRFNSEHYRKLVDIVISPQLMATTPHILTEVSNLLSQTDEQKRPLILKTFADLIINVSEIFLPGKDIVDGNYFYRLGLTDAMILKLKSDDYHLLSVDGPLCYACSVVGLPCTNLTPYFFE